MYRFKFGSSGFSVKRTQVSTAWEGENLSFYPEFGAALVNWHSLDVYSGFIGREIFQRHKALAFRLVR